MQDLRNVFITAEERRTIEEIELPRLRRGLRKKCQTRPDRDARACGSSGNGVPMPGEDCRQETIDGIRIRHLEEIVLKAQVIEPPKSLKQVEIGTVITLVYHVKNEKNQSRRVYERYEIVGYEQGDCSTDPPRLSYLAPLAWPFFKQPKGTTAIFVRHGKPVTMRLTNIRRAKKRT